MPSFQGFRDFTELFRVPVTPDMEKTLTKPPPEIGYSRKVEPGDFEKIHGGKVQSGVWHPHQSLGIDRSKMPQLKDRIDFLRWIISMGVKVERVSLSPASLIQDNEHNLKLAHAQNAIYIEKAMKKIKRRGVLSDLIVLSQENWIVDGNHHWLALMHVVPHMPVPMFRIRLPFYYIIDYTKMYPKTTYSA